MWRKWCVWLNSVHYVTLVVYMSYWDIWGYFFAELKCQITITKDLAWVGYIFPHKYSWVKLNKLYLVIDRCLRDWMNTLRLQSWLQRSVLCKFKLGFSGDSQFAGFWDKGSQCKLEFFSYAVLGLIENHSRLPETTGSTKEFWIKLSIIYLRKQQ